MARIFLSYRREDSAGYAGRLYDRLRHHFGDDNLFMDVDHIDLGEDFVEVIQKAVSSCDVLLAVIGRHWLHSTDADGQRRLDNPEDFVRVEITAALERNIRIIPILVGQASMPRSTELPKELRPLARRNALTIGDRFHPDVDRLIASLDAVLTPPTPPLAPSPAPRSPDQIRRAQTLLHRLQFDPGPIDAIWGSKTASALRQYQRRHGLSETDMLDGATLASLEAEVAKEAPRGELPQEITNSIGMEFVLIPAGEFMMGTPAEQLDAIAGDDTASREWIENETPQHRVTISQPFYMSKYAVTQAQWKAVMGGNPSHFKGDDRPVENVSWDDVQQFIEQLNEQEKRSSGILCRLPTEAEWEYAARAGTTTRYSFGDDASQLGDYAWYAENSGSETHPVGEKQPNAWGLYDMHGNMWEWVQDRYAEDYYRNSPDVDPQGPAAGAVRVVRGGSWSYTAQFARSAYRSRDDPGDRYVNLGFHCSSSGVSP